MQIKNLNNWLVIILMASILSAMLLIMRQHDEDIELQKKIYDHSEIKDTV